MNHPGTSEHGPGRTGKRKAPPAGTFTKQGGTRFQTEGAKSKSRKAQTVRSKFIRGAQRANFKRQQKKRDSR